MLQKGPFLRGRTPERVTREAQTSSVMNVWWLRPHPSQSIMGFQRMIHAQTFPVTSKQPQGALNPFQMSNISGVPFSYGHFLCRPERTQSFVHV